VKKIAMSNVIKFKQMTQSNVSAPPSRVKQVDFDKQYKAFIKNIKANKGQADVEELRYMGKILQKLIPLAAQVMATYKNDRAAKALEILMNQRREIIADIRALDSGPKHIDHINTRIVSPSMQAIMQAYMADYADLKRSLRKIKDKKLRDSILKKITDTSQAYGALLNAVSQGMETKLNEYFIGKVK
jgi:hypothetical protein